MSRTSPQRRSIQGQLSRSFHDLIGSDAAFLNTMLNGMNELAASFLSSLSHQSMDELLLSPFRLLFFTPNSVNKNSVVSQIADAPRDRFSDETLFHIGRGAAREEVELLMIFMFGVCKAARKPESLSNVGTTLVLNNTSEEDAFEKLAVEHQLDLKPKIVIHGLTCQGATFQSVSPMTRKENTWVATGFDGWFMGHSRQDPLQPAFDGYIKTKLEH